MLAEQLLKSPGFLYHVSGNYYYLGKWIYKECTETEATDCVVMYNMCRSNGEEAETNLYFQKIRAFSDFALEVPYNPAKIKQGMESLISSLADTELAELEKQHQYFVEDLEKYCGETI